MMRASRDWCLGVRPKSGRGEVEQKEDEIEETKKRKEIQSSVVSRHGGEGKI